MKRIEADIFQAVVINYDILHPSLNHSVLMRGLYLVLCHSGTISANANYESISCKAGDFFVIIPNTIFALKSVSKDYMAKAIYIPPKHITDITVALQDINLEQVLKFNKLTLDSQLNNDLESLHTIMMHQLEKPMTLYRRKLVLGLINSYIFIILGNINERTGTADPNPSNKQMIARNFLITLLNGYREHKDVDYYAATLYVSSKYLSKVVKEITTFSPQEWINKTLFMEAQRLLANTNLDITQIAEQLGYSSTSTFSRFFKQNTGLTPMEFRKQHTTQE